ncbi:hypothetical protein PK35_04195 [Tamlana nanhaiensis]|uniref:DUF4382 domain-containing protein n=1 Tax=Neotamlana nanhaiensis TaxID=1382798 RepID=A0A0D7W5G3_9FLAO|nr:DUF4382 domain-containing protein [Tamlana nanhaiensis]KJD33943.1 hypothetical protein PK35_04195 [Tamlana nanhaiensis]
MSILKSFKFIIPIIALAFFFSCDENETSSISQGEPKISVKLVDGPGDFEAVNVEVVDVMVKMNDDSNSDEGWISLEANNETVNLLDFTGGISKVLVDRYPIPAGTLSQMRLVLGDGNTIVIEGDNSELNEFDLKTPSAQQSGLKLKVNTIIEEGYTYDFVLDFDVEKSIVMAGNSDNIILKPVLYVSAEVNSGIIQGSITPSDVPAIASVLVDDMGNDDPTDDYVITAYTDDAGSFALWGVPAGTYDVVVTPVSDGTNYNEGSKTDVTVVNGEVTTIPDPIELMHKSGTISGTISGLADGVLATISINDANTTSIETNASGEFVIENVTPGDYIVSITAAGYLTQEFTITLEPEEMEIVDAALVLE